jgi:DNA invertase Pin-like site-specific DNA recombinase
MESLTIKTNAIFYLRVSTDRQADGAVAQLELLRASAKDLGIELPIGQDELMCAISSRKNELGPLYLDFGVSGYFEKTRPGYQKFLHRALHDCEISHVFTPARDRIARPEDAAEYASREYRIRAAGKTLVVGSKVLPPLNRGDDNTIDTLTASLEYGQGRAYLGNLANKMIVVKANKAKAGSWGGGRAPYGFTRVLVDPHGKVVRALNDGECIRQPGFSVSLRCGDVDQIRIWHDIILKHYDPSGPNFGKKRIAIYLNDRGIRSSAYGRNRRNRNETSARRPPSLWSQATVADLIDNPTIIGVLRYGKKATGDHARLGKHGIPRKLTLAETPLPNAPAKSNQNPEDIQIKSQGSWLQDGWLLDVNGKKCFKVDFALWERCRQKRKANAISQRGIARCKDSSRYLLAGLVRCRHCGTVMYGVPFKNTLWYACGLYIYSSGRKCERFWVKQEVLLPAVLKTIRERALPQEATLRQMMTEILAKQSDQRVSDIEHMKMQKARDQQAQLIKKALEAVSLAQDEDERKGLRQIYQRERAILEELDSKMQPAHLVSIKNVGENLIDSAIEDLRNLRCRLDDVTECKETSELLHTLNTRVWLKFKKIPWGKRQINQFESGIVCLGRAPNPTIDAHSHEYQGDSLRMGNNEAGNHHLRRCAIRHLRNCSTD